MERDSRSEGPLSRVAGGRALKRSRREGIFQMQKSNHSKGSQSRPRKGSWLWSPFSLMRRIADEMDQLAERMGLTVGLDPGVRTSGRQRESRTSSYSGRRHV
jgi:hypothetical protein